MTAGMVGVAWRHPVEVPSSDSQQGIPFRRGKPFEQGERVYCCHGSSRLGVQVTLVVD
jgi:hypothetical protein